ncbi:MAG: hypothetical protein FWC89_02095 [Defluviitaleaceae bacterium]|nr:hypothetical protein [Defluviitaleaceae bacterium]
MLGVGNPKIRVAISDPKLKDKIKVDLTGNADHIFWHIRFNLPLDPSTVNEKSMEVTDTEGYVMRTDISYHAGSNQIAISPLDTYEEQRYYLLKISKKVRSAKGQNLKTIINVLFKLEQRRIAEYRTMREDVPVPESRPRPPNYDEMQKDYVPNDLDNYMDNLPLRTKMAPESVMINPLLAIAGFITVLIAFFVANTIAIIVGIILSILGAAHFYAQWKNKVIRGKMLYNKGVRHFNKMQYQLAKAAFKKALDTNPANELARYGLVRVGIYK